jgi:PAS domain S-box
VGYKPKELVGKSFLGFINKDQGYLKQRIDLLKDDIKLTSEHKVISKTGDDRWLRFSTKAVFEDGKFTGGAGTLIDITPTKQTEAELMKSEALYRSVLSASPDVITITNMEGEIVLSSPAALKTFGINDLSSTLGKPIFDYIDSKDHPDVINAINKMLQTNYKGPEEFYAKKSDGSVFQIEVNGDFIRDEQGIPTNMVFVTRDISERKKAEENLRKSEATYRHLIETINDVIYEITNDGTVKFVSPAFKKVTGYEPSEIIGSNIFKIVHPDDIPELIERMASRDKSQPTYFDLRLISKQSDIVWVRSFPTKIYENSKVIGRTGILTDITNQKMAEFELKKTEESFKQIIENLNDVVYEVTAEGIVKYVSPSIEKFLGYKSSELIGQNFFNYMYEDDFPKIVKRLQTLDKRDYSFLEYRYYSKNKEIKWVRSSTNPIFVDGKMVGGRGVLIDVTEQKKAEEKLHESEARYKTFFEGNNSIMLLIDPQTGEINDANPAACRFYGWPHEEICLMNITQINTLPFEEISVKMDQSVQASQQYFHFKHRIRSGEIRDVEVYSGPIMFGKSKLLYSIVHDITERKQFEEKLIESEARFRMVFENAFDGISIFEENDNPEKRKLVECNDQYAAMAGMSKKELLKIGNIFKLTQPVEKMSNEKRIRGISAKSAFQGSFKWLRPDGKENFIEYIARPITWQGKSYSIGIDRDVTESRRIQKELAEREAELNFAQTIANMGNWTLNLKTKKMTWSENYARMLGADQIGAEDQGNFFADILHVDDKHLLDEMFDKMQKTKKPISQNMRILMPDKTIKWIQNNVVPIFEDGKMVMLKGVNIDITEKKLADEKIEQQNENLAAIINAIPDLIFITDADGTYLEYFRSRLSGGLIIPEDQLIGTNIKDIFNDETSTLHLHKTDECIATQQLVSYEYTLTQNDQKKYFEARLVPLSNNKVLRFIRDFTDARTKDSELRKLSLAIDQSPVSVVITDPNANIQYTNPAFITTTGYSPDELLGRNANILKSGLTSRETYNKLWETIRKGQSWRGEWINRKKNGELYWENISITPIYSDSGELINYLAIKQDITDRKKADQEIRELNANLEIKIQERTAQLNEANQNLKKEIEERIRSEEETQKARLAAEQANQAKSEFLSRMSHELRTPMNSILGFAQLLEMGTLNPNQAKGVTHIIKSGRHLLDLINEVLDISRIESGHLSLSIEPIQIDSLIGEMIDTIKPQAFDRQIEVNYSIPANQNLFVRSDKQRLKQVLLNLLNNAVKYNKEKGSITVKAEKISDKIVRISVIDNGQGIPKDDLPKLFTPFERIGAEKTLTEGTGLGLSVVKKLMEAMGGSYGVDSIAGKGSTFWIELPYCESQIEKAFSSGEIDSASIVHSKTGTILYVEDNKSNVELVEQILSNQRNDIQIITETHGKNAFSMVIKYKPDLILLDLNLPDIHGSVVLQQLHANVATKSIPIVVITADAMPQQIRKILKLGAKHYFTKPLDIPEFIRLIQEYLPSKNNDSN